jgi:hypothetical protein
MAMTSQEVFDLCIGRLDHCLSQLIGYAALAGMKVIGGFMDDANRQTLKHHAEDMQGAAGKILKLLGVIEDNEEPKKEAQNDL